MYTVDRHSVLSNDRWKGIDLFKFKGEDVGENSKGHFEFSLSGC